MITGGEEGKRRLNLLAESLRPTTLRLLDEAGLRRGDRCLDLGCGGGDVTLDMAPRRPGWYSCPHDPANARFEELFAEVVRLGGGDPDIGRRLPVIALAAGLNDLHCHAFQPVHVSGPYKRIAEMTMERIRPALLRHGLATDDEIDEIFAGMRTFAENPSTMRAMPRVIQIWGTA
jgi:hypothetical protein